MTYALALVAGILNMLQSGSNATLNDRLKVGPVIPTLIVYACGVLGVLAASPFIGKSTNGLMANAAQVPWWAWIGGFLGSFYVVTAVMTAKDMGAGAFMAVTVTAGVITSLVLDHFGLLGFDVRSLSALRVVGALLMIGGVTLIAKF